ncbi:hypothetical protein KQH56_00130 [bacterium]|nr:hypothetical protein [bacterium]
MRNVKLSTYLYGEHPKKRDVLFSTIAGILTGGFVLFILIGSNPALRWWQILIVVVIAFDLGSGTVANFLPSTRQFYSQEPVENEPGWSRFIRSPLGFASLHVYPILIWGVLTPDLIHFGLIWYLLLLGVTFVVERGFDDSFYRIAPLVMIVVLFLNSFLIPYPSGMAWFIPLFFIKLVVAHLWPCAQSV